MHFVLFYGIFISSHLKNSMGKNMRLYLYLH